MLSSVQATTDCMPSRSSDVELKLGRPQPVAGWHWFREEVGQVVRGGHATEVDEAQLLLIPPEVEVLGKGARRAGESDVATVADDSSVVLENRGGAQLVAAADDVASCGFSAAAGCLWRKRSLRSSRD